jgi:hypothetical protein
MRDFEKLGAFYLGAPYDLATGKRSGTPLLYDSRDLVTHALCVGMTGSGKTGLCLALIEEAALDGVPAILIDPKGDLGNLLLTFPDLSPADFRPWINEEDAARKGVSPEEFAKQQADLWKKGLAEWGEDGERIRKLRDSAEFAIYTPGSSAGIPVSILSSFAAPPAAVREDAEALRERVAGTATGLLTLIGVDADPVKSREHILVSTILSQAWSRGGSLDLPSLIAQIQAPPVSKIGVMEIETFFPSKERFALAMAANNLLAAPGFASWLEGEPLEAGRLLRSSSGKPRVAIVSIAHLAEAERMFFTTLLLNEVLSWMRGQPGTTSLRAILYMDEIAGYFPPVANPPAKAPLLTLLKQGRAFGLGVVLATQNPVDLDYKGLSNCGTWLLGRLQTERDKARVLEGLEGAAAGKSGGFDRARMEETLAGLGSRVFLMNNVHDDGPTVFETRWAMSYLRGPLTRSQIKTLMDPRRETRRIAAAPAPATGAAVAAPGPGSAGNRPVLPPEISQAFAPAPAGAAPLYRPAVLGMAEVHYADGKNGIASTEEVTLIAPFGAPVDPVRWEDAAPAPFSPEGLAAEPLAGARFEEAPSAAARAKSYEVWGKDLATHLARTRALTLWKSASRKLVSRPGESEADFRGRLAQAGRERRDGAVDKLRQKYAGRIATLQDRLRRAEQGVAREKQQASEAKLQTAISVGATVFDVLLGRKRSTVGRVTSSARGAGRAMRQAGDVARAEENVSAIRSQLGELEAQLEAEIAAAGGAGAAEEPLETVAIRPKKGDVTVRRVGLVWIPGGIGPERLRPSAPEIPPVSSSHRRSP